MIIDKISKGISAMPLFYSRITNVNKTKGSKLEL
jgi:hypothetical protein